MIVSLFLRNYKVYQNINYISISNSEKFCTLLGDNGVGKSSVLEALDSFFNGKAWNLNIIVRQRGLATRTPYIAPVVLIKKEDYTGDTALLEQLSQYLWSVDVDQINSINRAHFDKFKEDRQSLSNKINTNDYYLVCIGLENDHKFNTAIFAKDKIKELAFGNVDMSDNDLEEKLLKLYESIKNNIDYIYIPREIDPESFTLLEKREIQVLMGEKLSEVLGRVIPQARIDEINSGLREFIESISSELGEYSYRTPTQRQTNLRKNDLYSLIITAFFNIRKLHKQHGHDWLELSSLSSGEKQKAITEVAYAFLENHPESGKKIIFSIDEPESSLHLSACYDQFARLYQMSTKCLQGIFATHWYGFLPVIPNGYVNVISKNNVEHLYDTIDLSNYREEIRRQSSQTHGSLPIDIRLKSVNDFVQSIVSSVLKEEPYNWLICEGSSEKIYLEKYFSNLIREHKLRIIPVGGAKEVKKIYERLISPFEEYSDQINGKVYCLLDTDAQLLTFQTRRHTKIICKRLLNNPASRQTTLVDITNGTVSPATEIENCLDSNTYFHTLLFFKVNGASSLVFLDEELSFNQADNSHFAFDFRPSEKTLIDSFFDEENHKYEFAVKYSELLPEDYIMPSWLEEIKTFFSPS